MKDEQNQPSRASIEHQIFQLEQGLSKARAQLADHHQKQLAQLSRAQSLLKLQLDLCLEELHATQLKSEQQIKSMAKSHQTQLSGKYRLLEEQQAKIITLGNEMQRVRAQQRGQKEQLLCSLQQKQAKLLSQRQCRKAAESEMQEQIRKLQLKGQTLEAEKNKQTAEWQSRLKQVQKEAEVALTKQQLRLKEMVEGIHSSEANRRSKEDSAASARIVKLDLENKALAEGNSNLRRRVAELEARNDEKVKQLQLQLRECQYQVQSSSKLRAFQKEDWTRRESKFKAQVASLQTRVEELEAKDTARPEQSAFEQGRQAAVKVVLLEQKLEEMKSKLRRVQLQRNSLLREKEQGQQQRADLQRKIQQQRRQHLQRQEQNRQLNKEQSKPHDIYEEENRKFMAMNQKLVGELERLRGEVRMLEKENRLLVSKVASFHIVEEKSRLVTEENGQSDIQFFLGGRQPARLLADQVPETKSRYQEFFE